MKLVEGGLLHRADVRLQAQSLVAGDAEVIEVPVQDVEVQTGRAVEANAPLRAQVGKESPCPPVFGPDLESPILAGLFDGGADLVAGANVARPLEQGSGRFLQFPRCPSVITRR